MEFVVLLLVCVAPVVWCYSSGKVMDSCEDMQPHHAGLTPQTEPAPFTITTDHGSYTPGEEVKVQLQATASTPFTGFLLQAREVGGRTPVGYFVLTSGATQLLTCSHSPNSAVSHRSESAKTSIQVIWRSDASADQKPIQFHASFVQNYRTFWVDVTSPALNFTNNSTSGSTSPTTTPTMTTDTSIHQPAPLSISISSADCGITKVCFSQPSSCDPTVSADCYFMSAMMLSTSDGAIRYEMTGPTDGYISFGFSDDQRMGNDDIYICGIGSDGLVRLEHAFSMGQTTPQALPLGNVSDVRASVQNRVISCSFISMNTISTQRTTGINKTYHLMFAHGPSSNGQIQFHTATFISTDKVNISRPQRVGKAGWPHIIKAHGALMLIAWMTMGSVGMMVARYLKGAAKRQNLWGKDVWFLVHVAVMSVTIAVTVIAFILSFTHVKAWSGGAHPVLGCLVMIFSLLQPIVALLRCGPQHPLRFLFYWTHTLNGAAIKILSVAAIFTGLKLTDSTLDQWLMKVMGGFVGWEVLFYILLDVHLKWNAIRPDVERSASDAEGKEGCESEDVRQDPLESTKISTDILLMALFFLGNLIFLVALLVGIGMS